MVKRTGCARGIGASVRDNLLGGRAPQFWGLLFPPIVQSIFARPSLIDSYTCFCRECLRNWGHIEVLRSRWLFLIRMHLFVRGGLEQSDFEVIDLHLHEFRGRRVDT